MRLIVTVVELHDGERQGQAEVDSHEEGESNSCNFLLVLVILYLNLHGARVVAGHKGRILPGRAVEVVLTVGGSSVKSLLHFIYFIVESAVNEVEFKF